MTNLALINLAAKLIKSRKTKKGLFADVGCVLISATGKLYQGVCLAAGANVFCAESIAIGAMVTAGEYRLKTIVAVWGDNRGKFFVISPCGNCRQLIYTLHKGNLQTKVILDKNKTVALAELLPYYNWWQKQ